jgi:hypothetical protein
MILMAWQAILSFGRMSSIWFFQFNPLNTKLNPTCHLLALLAAHHILHISRIRVNVSFIWIPRNFILDTVEIWLFKRVIFKWGLGLFLLVNCIKWVLFIFIERRFVFNHSLIKFKVDVIFSSKSLLLGLVIRMVVSSANNIGVAIENFFLLFTTYNIPKNNT